MTEAQIKYINRYPASNHMLKHKDAVKLCINFLQNWGEYLLTQSDIEYICNEYKKKCYIGSEKWEK